MKTYNVTVPEIGIVAATRGMAGAGIGLLASNYLRPEVRRAVGWTLLAVGALTTIPLAAGVIFREQTSEPTAPRFAGGNRSPAAQTLTTP